MKKIFKIVSCGLIALSLTGCGNTPTPSNGNENVISFNKEELNITVDDLYKDLKSRYGANYLIQLMDDKILSLEYETDEEANKYVENQMKVYRMYYGNSDEELLNQLQNAGYQSIKDFENALIVNYKRTLATKDYIKENISESEITKYYENNVYGDITVSHILITLDTNNDLTDEEKKEKEEKVQEKIKEIYKKLDEGTSFQEVAKEYSDDTATASDGGRIGTFNKNEMTEKFNSEFEKTATELKVNEYSKKTVQSSYGYHIIFKDSEKEKPALETVKETIIDKLVEEKQEDDKKIQYKALIALREKYGLSFNDDDIKSQYDTAVNNWLYSKDEEE